ncbi:uncharacterized protein LOC143209808 [Lasioglossum baleicum]|uniref:uncharacterized protein LOC143209808 n=1 Tax=Lasioglossum baleicum TaxID=434251 RepID=UPI003FCEA601
MVMVSELKEILKENGLSTAGTKNELIKRLLDAGIPVPTPVETPPISEMQATTSDIQETDVSHQVREIEILRRERNLAAREAELLRRELDLLRTTQQDRSDRQGSYRQGSDHQDSDRPVRIRVRKWQELKGMAAEYDGQNLDYDKWEKQVLSLLSSYELDQHEKKALLCSRLTGKVLRWYHSRIDCVDLNSDDLLREMKKMYGLRPDPLVLRREFEKRIWRTGETFSDYLHDKVMLGNRVPVTGAEMISYVIEGIQSETLRTQSKIQRYESIEALQEAFANVPVPRETLRRPFIQRERVLQPSREQQIDQQTRKQMEPGTQRCNENGHIARNCPKTKKPMEQPGTRRCYNCNEGGHIAYDCPKPKRERGSCFKCGKSDHQANQCSSSSNINYVGEQRDDDDDFQRQVEMRIKNKDSIFSVSVNALIDSGSPICFIKERYILRDCVTTDLHDNRFCGINGSNLNVLGYTEATVISDNTEYDVLLRVVPDRTMQSPMILGRDFIKLAKMSLTVKDEVNEIMNIGIEKHDSDSKTTSQDMKINPGIPTEIQMRLRELFDTYYVNVQRPSQPAVDNVMKLTLVDERPFSYTPRRLSYDEKNKLRNILDELLAKGIIRESTSEYASPIVLTKKKNGETRKEIDRGEISVYLDDFLIMTETIEHHLQILEHVFKLLVANKLKLRLDKCNVLQTKLDYLGYTINDEGIRPTKRGLEAVANFPKFVEGFSIIAKPLYDLVKKDIKFRFTEIEKQAFESLKERLLQAQILSIYSPRDETQLHCDANQEPECHTSML